MASLSERLACALRGRPCERVYRIEALRVGDTVTVVKGTPPPPLCESCPQRDNERPPSELGIRSLTVVRTYSEEDDK
jgi:hypothetical protein